MTRYFRVSDADYGEVFQLAWEKTPAIREACSEWSEPSPGAHFLAGDALSGYVVRPDGELCLVFSLVSGRGHDLMRHAVAEGASRLDCNDGFLVDFYASHGFVVTEVQPNYTPGGPDVVYMRRGV